MIGQPIAPSGRVFRNKVEKMMLLKRATYRVFSAIEIAIVFLVIYRPSRVRFFRYHAAPEADSPRTRDRQSIAAFMGAALEILASCARRWTSW